MCLLYLHIFTLIKDGEGMRGYHITISIKRKLFVNSLRYSYTLRYTLRVSSIDRIPE